VRGHRGTVDMRVVRLLAVLRDEGASGVVARAAGRASDRWGDASEKLNLLPEHVADASRIDREWLPSNPRSGLPLTIGWIASGAEGSGGHTTIFRMVEALEQSGHRCVVYIYDGVGSPASRYERTMRRWWPGVRAEIRDLSAGLGGCDGYVATAWPTAHVLASQVDLPGARFYLVQDYEPYFYPRGSQGSGILGL